MLENQSQNKNQHPRNTLCVWVCTNYHAKQIAFSDQIYPKMDLGLKIQKTNVGIRMIILEILC